LARVAPEKEGTFRLLCPAACKRKAEESGMGRKSKTRLELVSTGSFRAYEVSFDKESRARLRKICSQGDFIEAVEDIASRFKSNLKVHNQVSGFKERKRFLNILKKRTELLIEALEEGPKSEPNFISIGAAVARLKLLERELSEEDILLMIQHKKIRFERCQEKLRVCGEDLGLSWSFPSYADELVSGSQNAIPVLKELHQNILNALSSQKLAMESVTSTLCRTLMVRELADLFRRNGLNPSHSEPSRFSECLSIVLRAADAAIGDVRSLLRSLPKSIFKKTSHNHPH
jgi:hypothetical protein